MDSTKIKALIIGALAAFAALYLGITAATAQLETIAWVAGTTALVTCLLLGRKIWLIVPFAAALGLTFRLPGLPTSLLLSQFLFFGFATLLFLMRKLPFRLRFTELEFWMIAIVACVIQVYMRNPVGVNIFGGDTVGGRPYAIFAITAMTSFIIALHIVPETELRWLLRLKIIGGIANFVILTIGTIIPGLGIWVGAVSGFEKEGAQTFGSETATRVGFLGNVGRFTSNLVGSYISPIAALFRPLWLLLILFSIAAAGLSGFRNQIIAVGLTYACATMYRGGFIQIMIGGVLGALALALIALTNSLHPLPANIQRSLSFLPGTWEERYLSDAETSTDWRVELWKEVLFTDRWISNKWLGDGLGFTKQELIAQLAAQDNKLKGISGFDAHRENILANGDYHSGPVQTIRTIGYGGLAVLLLAMIRLGVHAHRQIIRCRGTEWFPLALFVGLPLIWGPFFFVFVFGSFQIGATEFLMGAAFIRILENNLPLPAYVHRRSRLHVPLILRDNGMSRQDGALTTR